MPSRDDRERAWLSTLVEPVSADDFLGSYWQRRHLFCRGRPDRFAALLPWPILNGILARHWRETYRFRLAKEGRDLELASYAEFGGSTPRIRPKDVTESLRCGATLAFHAIDEIHEPLKRIAESFERLFGASTQINVYAGWRALHGLDVHCDDEEVFVLQVDGRKRWRLDGATRDAQPPVLDQVLEPGNLLYMPRGCYHVAIPLDEPTLHLTVGIRMPREGDEASNVTPRPSFSLPWSATAARLPPGRDFLLRVNGSLPLVIAGNTDATSIEVQCGNHSYRFPRAMLRIVEQLDQTAPVSMRDLVDGLAPDLDEEAVRLLVAMLVKSDLVALLT
jgi:hypothetical protein